MKNEDKWFEMWYSEGEDVIPHYLLVVTLCPDNDKEVVIIDPMENNKIVHRSQGYEDAVLWLQEDEFLQITGRMFPMRFD